METSPCHGDDPSGRLSGSKGAKQYYSAIVVAEVTLLSDFPGGTDKNW